MRQELKKKLKKYDVVLVDFGDSVFDSEQKGLRMAVVVQNDVGNFYSSTTIVLPFTSQIKKLNMPTHTLVKKGAEKGLKKDSVLLGECIRQISKKRIIKCLGRITSLNEQQQIRKCYEANFAD